MEVRDVRCFSGWTNVDSFIIQVLENEQESEKDEWVFQSEIHTSAYYGEKDKLEELLKTSKNI